MSLANDLAIIITRKIESDLVLLCSQVTQMDEKAIRAAPNFYMIREKILSSLAHYIVEYGVSQSADPVRERDLPLEIVENIREYELKKKAALILEEILENEEMVKTTVLDDEWARFRNTTYELMFIKAGMVWKDSRDTR